MHIQHSSDNENQQPLDDFGQFFKAQAEGLAPDPPQEAWHRLENKLESRRINRKLVTYRYTSIAAAAVGIIALIMATQLIGRIGKFSEEIAVKQDTLTQDQQRIADAIRQHREEQIALNAPTTDGSSNDAPAPRTTTEPISQPTPKASPRDIRRKANEPNRRDALDVPPAPIAQKEVVIKKQEARRDAPIAEEIVEEDAEEVTDIDEYVLDDMTLHEAPVVVQDYARPAAPSSPTKDSPTVAQRVTASDVIKNTQVAPATSQNSPSSSSYSDRASRSRMQGSMGLQLFDWLSGDWSSHYDTWRFDRNRNQLIGTSGYQAPMRITQARGALSLTLIGEKRAFEVSQELGNQITFERGGWAFPKRVTITRLAGDQITIRLSEGRLTEKTKSHADYARFFNWDDNGASLELTRK